MNKIIPVLIIYTIIIMNFLLLIKYIFKLFKNKETFFIYFQIILLGISLHLLTYLLFAYFFEV